MKRAWLLALPLSLAPVAGCVAVAAAAAGTVGFVQYDRNQAHRDFDVELEQAWQAATAAAPELGYPPIAVKTHTPSEGEFEVEDLWVRVEQHPDGYACVAVRIGTFDNDQHRRRAALFLNEVAIRLGEEPDRVPGAAAGEEPDQVPGAPGEDL